MKYLYNSLFAGDGRGIRSILNKIFYSYSLIALIISQDSFTLDPFVRFKLDWRSKFQFSFWMAMCAEGRYETRKDLIKFKLEYSLYFFIVFLLFNRYPRNDCSRITQRLISLIGELVSSEWFEKYSPLALRATKIYPRKSIANTFAARYIILNCIQNPLRIGAIKEAGTIGGSSVLV